MTHNKNDVISENYDICQLLTLFNYECGSNRYFLVNKVNNGKYVFFLELKRKIL